MIWAWIGAAAVGLSLGLLGSGGAILTVPILVYIVGHDEKTAIAESLAIVGVVALAGAIRAAIERKLDFSSALLLAGPGIVGTYAGASLAGHIPGTVQLALLAGIMLLAAVLMSGILPRRLSHERGAGTDSASPPLHGPDPRRVRALGLTAAQGVGLGLVTGLVGVGGGFLIVPTLVLLRRVPMPTAVGTSLAIIAVNCAVGFIKYITVVAGHVGAGGGSLRVDWSIITVFCVLGVAGSLVGSAISGRLRQATLKRIFAVFLVLMAAYILVRQIPRVLPDGPRESPAAIGGDAEGRTTPTPEPP